MNKIISQQITEKTIGDVIDYHNSLLESYLTSQKEIQSKLDKIAVELDNTDFKFTVLTKRIDQFEKDLHSAGNLYSKELASEESFKDNLHSKEFSKELQTQRKKQATKKFIDIANRKD